MRFRSVPEPAEVQQRVNRQVKDAEPGDDGKADVLDEVLEELRAIRAELEANG